MSYLENSPLKYLKDNDVILMLLEYVENTHKYSKIYHINLHKRLHLNNLNFKKKCEIDKTFGCIYQAHLNNKMVSLIPSSYPFYQNWYSGWLDVKHAVKVYEIILDMVKNKDRPYNAVDRGQNLKY